MCVSFICRMCLLSTEGDRQLRENKAVVIMNVQLFEHCSAQLLYMGCNPYFLARTVDTKPLFECNATVRLFKHYNWFLPSVCGHLWKLRNVHLLFFHFSSCFRRNTVHLVFFLPIYRIIDLLCLIVPIFFLQELQLVSLHHFLSLLPNFPAPFPSPSAWNQLTRPYLQTSWHATQEFCQIPWLPALFVMAYKRKKLWLSKFPTGPLGELDLCFISKTTKYLCVQQKR